MKTSIVTIAIAVICALQCSAFRVGDYEYAFNSSEDSGGNGMPKVGIRIVGYHGTESSIILPSSVTYEGVRYEVTAIGDGAFSRKAIDSVVISEPVEYIGYSAFSNAKLGFVSLPSTLKRIQTGAFENIPVKRMECHSILPPVSPVYEEWGMGNTFETYSFSNIFREAEWSRDINDPNPSKRPNPKIDAILAIPAVSEKLYRNITKGNDGCVWGYFKTIEKLPESAVEDVLMSEDADDIFDIEGRVIKANATPGDLRTLPQGIYIYKGRKIII